MEKDLTKLREQHSNLLASASDLGLEIPDNLAVEFYSAKFGNGLCKKLQDLIEKGRHSASLKQKEADLAKKAKKTAVKKTAKKAAKKAAPKKARAGAFADDATIKVKSGAENPCRPGKERFERVAKMLKSNGKTVAASGVRTSTLRFGVENGLISIA